MLDDINAEQTINIGKNTSTTSKGCPLRKNEFFLLKKLGSIVLFLFGNPGMTVTPTGKVIHGY
jgi:hypothetical protein